MNLVYSWAMLWLPNGQSKVYTTVSHGVSGFNSAYTTEKSAAYGAMSNYLLLHLYKVEIITINFVILKAI